MNTTMVDFIGNNTGKWRVLNMGTVIGEPIFTFPYLNIVESSHGKMAEGIWTLKGFSSNIRYTEKAEKEQLTAIQAGLGRAEATLAAMIPIRKNEAWWALAQDERRKIFENKSHHTAVGLQYLPAIARKLYHCKDLGEPFDFITWFEYAPEHSNAFEELVTKLRKTEEWNYIDREIDIRLERV
jgi:chlorite dismutase